MSQIGNLMYRHAVALNPMLPKTNVKPKEPRSSPKTCKYREELAKLEDTYTANKRAALAEFTDALRADKELWKLVVNNFSTLRELLEFIKASGKS